MNFDFGKLSGEYVILGAFVVLSYFTHVGWWSITGLAFFLGLMTYDIGGKEYKDDANLRALGGMLFIVSVLLFIIAIVRTGWVF
jgi:hypothetical protein